MRVTDQFLFDNFQSDNSRVLKELNRLNTQISSGQKIQNSYDDSAVYADKLKFESQESELKALKSRVTSAKSFADATDSVLSDFTQTLRDFKTKLIQASNATMNSDNLKTVATELKEMKKHLISLANSQINGEYLFSGSAVNSRPINERGEYMGNDKAIMTLVGKGVNIQNNIDGKSLFLGESLEVKKSIETNVRLKNLISDEPLTAQSSIREMVGDSDTNSTNDKSVHFFISGVKRDGEAFKDVVEIETTAKIEDLLNKIRDNFGDGVTVELNRDGNIAITEKVGGYSKIDFKMVGVQGISDPLERDLTSVTGDKIIPFSKSNFKALNPALDQSLQMDRLYFEKSGGILKGNVPLIVDGSFAESRSKFSEIMGVDASSMPDKVFNMSIKDINGANKSIELSLATPSIFKVDGVSYNIYNADETLTDKGDFTVGQLNGIISMVLSDNLPASSPSTALEFNSALKSAKEVVSSSINQDGVLEIKDLSNNLSNIEFSLFDADANDFSKPSTPSISFISNNAVTISSANLNFFGELDLVIESIESGNRALDSNSKDPRNIGIQNSITKLEQMSNHFNSAQAQIGIRSKSLEISFDKASALEVNVAKLKSEATEVDLAETILKLNQVTMSYQAMLQTISKINSLSLLNYMK